MSIQAPTSNYFQWVPIPTPAVKEDSCEVDHDLLISRVRKIGLAAMAFLAAACAVVAAYPSVTVLITLPVLLFFPTICFVDNWAAGRAANAKAVNEYLTMTFPSQSATYRIQHNLHAAKLLVRKNGDLNKRNEVGDCLLSAVEYMDYKVFKHLVDHGIDLTIRDRCGKSLFKKIVNRDDVAFLKYVITQNKITAADFHQSQQVNLWLNLGNKKAGPLLAEHGFDVNIRNDKGFTPLLKVVEQLSNRFAHWPRRRLGINLLVTTLLNVGADPLLTIEDEGVQKNALEINTNPVIREIFEQSQKHTA